MKLAAVLGARRRARHIANLSRHRRKCSICNRKDRQAIDADFLLWRPAHIIVKGYAIGSRSILYRHASATGLLLQRQANFHTVLDSIVEQVETVKVTGATILRAIRAYSCLNARGRWSDPPRRMIIERPVSSRGSSSSLQPQAPSVQNLTGTPPIKKCAKHLKTNAAADF